MISKMKSYNFFRMFFSLVIFSLLLFFIFFKFDISSGTSTGENLEKITGDLIVDGVISGTLLLDFDSTVVESGEICCSAYYMAVLGEGAVNDDIDTISGGSDDMIVTIFPVNSDSDIKLKHGTGNLDLNGADINLKNFGNIAILRREGSGWKIIFTNA